MSFVHCLVCLRFPEAELRFFMSSCGHVACFNCVEKGAMTLQCKICQKANPQVVEVNSRMKPELLDLFSPMNRSLATAEKEIMDILDFHTSQREHLMKYHKAKGSAFDRLKVAYATEIRKKAEYKQEVLRLREFKTKAEDFIKNQMASKAQTQQPPPQRVVTQTFTDNMNITSVTHDPFRTPGHFMSSTPCVKPRSNKVDSNSTMHTTANVSDLSNSSNVSFAAVTGMALNTTDNCTQMANLVKLTSAMKSNDATSTSRNSSNTSKPITPKRAAPSSNSSMRSFAQGVEQAAPKPTFKTPTKKSRLDMVNRTAPLPLKM